MGRYQGIGHDPGIGRLGLPILGIHLRDRHRLRAELPVYPPQFPVSFSSSHPTRTLSPGFPPIDKTKCAGGLRRVKDGMWGEMALGI